MNLKLMALAIVFGVPGSAAMAQGSPTAISTKSGALPEPPAGQGQVVFFRPGSLLGVALGCTVNEGEAELARLGSGKYYVVPATPGAHEYYTKGMRTDKLTLNVEEGDTYFVKCNLGMGLVAGSANLSPSDRETFAQKAKGLKMSTGKADAPTAVAAEK